MTKVLINLALCKTYLENAAHRGNCPLCWKNEGVNLACTCGLEDLRSFVSGMEAGAKQSVSVQSVVEFCTDPRCGLKEVPHKHVVVKNDP